MLDQKYIEMIRNNEHKNIIIKDDMMLTSDKRGIGPLLDLIEGNPAFLNGSTLYDILIGKAAAMLMDAYGVKEFFAGIISEEACKYLEGKNISYSYDEKVPFIENRTKDGMCPLEKASLNIDNSSEAYKVLRGVVDELMSLNKPKGT